jgi:hypothetical protein
MVTVFCIRSKHEVLTMDEACFSLEWSRSLWLDEHGARVAQYYLHGLAALFLFVLYCFYLIRHCSCWTIMCLSVCIAECHRKELDRVGERLLDQFKQHQDEHNGRRKKEKRNSTKKELHEDGQLLSESLLLTVFMSAPKFHECTLL